MSHSLTMTREARQRYVMQRARQARGLSQRELGQRVGVSPATISQLENGRKSLNPRLAERLANALQLQGQALQQLLDTDDAAQWRRWIWRSRCTPNEKLLLLALLDRSAQATDTEGLVEQTGLPEGTVRALTDALHRQGLLRRIFDSQTGAQAWCFALTPAHGAQQP
ncbi:MAG: helix-turn-helix transcriptional regulator [Lamprobacter sp.]|uniref:helix-turn-helix domain-containing protein n=1 Tax=Lamprobacter sp. TaxID=3100796 RepID=UPI002B256C6E|nr:helix-turn-helix transcriptional regulator [Lamprobacter sp.]MEA3642236.1 helix-turn-helix transcriptional regulator [Lamprobacter sp.]